MQEHGAEQRALFRHWPSGVSVVVAELEGRPRVFADQGLTRFVVMEIFVANRGGRDETVGAGKCSRTKNRSVGVDLSSSSEKSKLLISAF